MSGWYPPHLQQARVGVTTSATPNTQAGNTILAVPGAGFRYRVWGLKMAFGTTSQAPARTYIVLTDLAGGSVLLDLSADSFAERSEWPPGGFAYPGNAGIRVVHASSVASIDIVVELFYTTEAV